jgi:transposase
MSALSLVPDALWEAIESLLPKEPPKPNGGRPRVPDRAALAGIVFVLRTGCPWRLLPQELGCGSGTTCWRRLRDWQEAGVWEKLHVRLLNWLGDEAAVAWPRASVDSLSVRAKRGASRRGRTRRTAASLAPNTTLSSTSTASRSPSGFQPPMPMTLPSCFPSSTPFLQSSVHEASRVGRANVRPSCTLTRPTIPCPSGVPSVPGASPRASRDAASTPPSDWAGIGGSSSGRRPGWWAIAASVCATSDAPTCSKACSTWLAL